MFDSVESLPPGKLLASYTVTLYPLLRIRIEAAIPETPAPITAQLLLFSLIMKFYWSSKIKYDLVIHDYQFTFGSVLV